MTCRRDRTISGRSGVTLVEVIVALAIGGLMMAAVAFGFMQCMRRAEWSSFSLAANSLALQRLEQARAAGWNSADATNDLVSAKFPADRQMLDVAFGTSNVLWATNFTTITTLSTNPPLKLVRVDCVWRFRARFIYQYDRDVSGA
ncbi:MAG: type II secretion system protein [Verrucomicrobiota bacterium]